MLPYDSPRKTIHIDVIDCLGCGNFASNMIKPIFGFRSTLTRVGYSPSVAHEKQSKEILGASLGIAGFWCCLRALFRLVRQRMGDSIQKNKTTLKDYRKTCVHRKGFFLSWFEGFPTAQGRPGGRPGVPEQVGKAPVLPCSRSLAFPWTP